MDANTLITFGIPAITLGVMVYRRVFKSTRQASAPDAIPMTEVMRAAEGSDEIAPLPLATVLALLNDKRDAIPHCFVIGGTGAGKSTIGRLLLAPRIARGEQFVIVTGKRTAVFEDLPCIGRGATGEDGKLNFEAVRQAFIALSRELARRDNTPLKSRTFTTLNIVIDDATILLDELPEAAQFLRDAALLGRELDMRLIVLLGSLRVKELGWEGRGDLREHFAVVTLRKNLADERSASIRPRFDDKNDIPFDACQVPHIAPRLRIDPGRAWRPVRDPDAELADQLGIDPSVLMGAESGQKDADGRTDGRTDEEDDDTPAPGRDALIRHLKAQKVGRDGIRGALTAAGFKISSKRLSAFLSE